MDKQILKSYIYSLEERYKMKEINERQAILEIFDLVKDLVDVIPDKD